MRHMEEPHSGSRIGILGGTFNPIHMGHLILAQGAMETFELGTVLFVPCANPPHKRDRALVAAEHRVAMLQGAIESDPRFELCDIEIRRGGVSYAIDTVAELYKLYRGAELYFIIGADTLPELHLWKDIYSLLPLCRFISFARHGFEPAMLSPDALHLDPPWPRKLLRNLVPARRIDISSSDIRHRIAEGLSARYLVPESVEMYISEHGLYGL
jgi:nicotinate-nucleotide adenylyltransferase